MATHSRILAQGRQRSLTCYSPWDCEESDTTEQLSMCTHTHTYTHIFYKHLKLCVLSLLETMIYSCQLGKFITMFTLSAYLLIFFFGLLILSVIQRGLLKSLSIFLTCHFSCNSFNFYLVYFVSLLLLLLSRFSRVRLCVTP